MNTANGKKKTALITGVTGQDGAYLSRLLLDKGYRVYGAIRHSSDDPRIDRLKILKVDQKVEFVPLELSDYDQILRAIQKIHPDEVYNLGAQSSVALSFDEPLSTADVTGLGSLRVLQAVRSVDLKIRFYQASSSEMFGLATDSPQNEKTPFQPRSPYAVSRLFAHCMTVNYREAYGLFACSGILYNHESPLRPVEFVSRKIAKAVVNIKSGAQDELLLGNLDSRRDWGFAPEYVEAMWLMLQQPIAEDYVVSTGESHSVREFVELALLRVGIKVEWTGSKENEIGRDLSTGRVIVRVDPKYFRPTDVSDMRGDSSKARKKLGWTPTTGFKELVNIMVDYELTGVAKSAEVLSHQS